MNLLLDSLPTSVEIVGKEYPVRWEFQTMALLELLMQDEALTPEERFVQGLTLFYPTVPDDLEAATDFLLLFYRGGREARPEGNEKGGKTSSRIYSFQEDAGLIFAAFLGQYGIDLNAVQDLHWWKFLALFEALGEQTEFVKVVGYRVAEITPGMSKEQKDFYRRMKKLYALPLPKTVQQKQSAIEQALLGCGDLRGLL